MKRQESWSCSRDFLCIGKFDKKFQRVLHEFWGSRLVIVNVLSCDFHFISFHIKGVALQLS